VANTKEKFSMSDVKSKIRTFIVDNYLFGDDDGLEENTSFLDEGIVDSTGILELIEFISEEFSITVEDEELIPENLDSINNVTVFIGKKTGQANGSAAVG
jgi:acyl carrier protein